VAQAAIKRALSEMEASSDSAITFAKIVEYQKKLEEEFSLNVRADLFNLGVNPEIPFTMNLSPEGKISVNCDDQQAKAAIEQYLSDNPKVCEEFGYIQALANVERARQSPATLGTALRNATMELQASAVEAFMNDTLNSGTMDYSGMLAAFGGSEGTAKFYTGLSYKV
jgi:hypothetical protein